MRARQAVDVAHHVGVEAAQHFHDEGLHGVARGKRPRVRPRLVVRAQDELVLMLGGVAKARLAAERAGRLVSN